MLRMIFACAIMLISGLAHAQARLGIHGGTYHFWNRGLNETNPGMYYVSENGITVGGYYNSYRHPTFYAGLTIGKEKGFSVSLVLATGYKGQVKAFGNSPVVPILSPSYKYGVVRLSLPNLQGVHLSVEKEF